MLPSQVKEHLRRSFRELLKEAPFFNSYLRFKEEAVAKLLYSLSKESPVIQALARKVIDEPEFSKPPK
jgi:hypothetical protein